MPTKMTLGRWIRRIACTACLVTALASTAATLTTAAAAVTAASATGATYGFASPDALAVAGGKLWVANRANNSLTEVDATTGALVRRLSGRSYGFNQPDAVTPDGTHLFVANAGGRSVTEIGTASGSLVRVISASKFRLSHPLRLVADGAVMFVLNRTGSLTEIQVATGSLLRVISASEARSNGASAVTLAAGRLYVADAVPSGTGANPGWVSEINASTGQFVRRLTGPAYRFDHPAGIAYDGQHLWVSDGSSDALTEIGAATGQAMHVIDNSWSPTPGFNDPVPVVAVGSQVYVGSIGSVPMMTQVFTGTPRVGFWMCNSNGPYNFDVPDAMAVYSGVLWVANEGNDTLTKMAAGSGAFLASI